ncbi:hypothetical protein CY34DRAFT_366167 [Suillus luteus UH-Slu-Lm8-n1]|uniref:Uncharacterized protein n=1 Tax=Suillus luteus UH-Slu-Lm8-n1 TaxID=930992 RepID=A0A0D0AAT6_9AGAM|nr:hypothetical protein CY34DRAFT_366167 [Suillus luteus UH-Slu-Lm8-n1]
MSQFTSRPSSSCGSNCSSATTFPCNQPTSSSDLPGATTPHAPHTSHQACLNQHSEVGLATGSTSSTHTQASNSSLGRKRVAEDLDDRDTKRIKMESDGISPSPEIDAPSDACESQCGDDCDCGQLAAEGAQPSCSAACQGSVSYASATVVGASTVLRREFNIRRLVDEEEDSEDPFLPIFESVSSVLLETMLTEATDDPDVWQFIGVSEIGDFMDPDLLLCESLIDAAEDLDFCNYPIMTLLIGSWLNSSRWDALD